MAFATRPTYNDPAYLSRLSYNFGPLTAGSGGVTTKFVTAAAIQAFSLSCYMITAGTSTYTNTVTGVGTSVIDAQQVNLIVVTNTATAGATAALSTTTYGPFLAGGLYASGGTGTGQIGGINQYALNTATGTTGYGGIPIAAQSLIYIVSGTDATAVTNVSMDYQLAPLAPLTL
jgi:hypothetical protein